MRVTEFSKPIELHSELNPQLWENDQLRPEIAQHLLKIADDFIEFVDVPLEVEDIIVAGANANYTYTEYSDLDLHVVVDYAKVSCDREAAELFDSKRLLYKQRYKIKVLDIPVEPGIEDSRNPTVSAAYSILNKEWIRPPVKELPFYDEAEVKEVTEQWKDIIRLAMRTGNLGICRTVLKMLRKFRKIGLASKQGEFSIPNLVYKSLRNDKTIEGMQTLVDKLHDQTLSVH
jgi:hypothetical protein